MTIKIADNKGRILLGRKFAGCMVLIDDTDPDRIILTKAEAIPRREAWLYKNPIALEMVREGLEQARAGGRGKTPPDLEAGAALVDKLLD